MHAYTHTHTHTCARIHTHREKDGGEREREGTHRHKQWNTQKFLLTRHHQRRSCLQPGKVSWRGVFHAYTQTMKHPEVSTHKASSETFLSSARKGFMKGCISCIHTNNETARSFYSQGIIRDVLVFSQERFHEGVYFMHTHKQWNSQKFLLTRHHQRRSCLQPGKVSWRGVFHAYTQTMKHPEVSTHKASSETFLSSARKGFMKGCISCIHTNNETPRSFYSQGIIRDFLVFSQERFHEGVYFMHTHKQWNTQKFLLTRHHQRLSCLQPGKVSWRGVFHAYTQTMKHPEVSTHKASSETFLSSARKGFMKGCISCIHTNNETPRSFYSQGIIRDFLVFSQERFHEGVYFMHTHKQWNTQKFLLTRHHQRLSCLQPGKVSWRGVPRQEHWSTFPAGSALPPELHHTLQLTVTQVRILHLQLTLSVRSASLVISWQSQYTTTCFNTARNFPVHTHRVWSASLDGLKLHPRTHYKTLQYQYKHYSSHYWIFGFSSWLEISSRATLQNITTPVQTLQFTSFDHQLLWLASNFLPGHVTKHNNTSTNITVHIIWSSASLAGFKLPPALDYSTRHYKHYNTPYKYYTSNSLLNSSTASLKLSPGLHYNILHTLNAYKQYSSLFDDQRFKISS